MGWIFLAILAHVANGAVFVVDKSLLGKKSTIGKPIIYALYSAALAGLALVLLPFALPAWTPFILFWSAVTGVVHILALYVFFVAMREGEPSRVVPVTGSFVPLFTILFAFLFLGEAFTVSQFGGMLLLIAGGVLLSLRRMKGNMLNEVLFPLVAGSLFAAYFAITKYLYDSVDDAFLSVFMTTRIIESVIAIAAVFVFIGVPWKRGAGKKTSQTQIGGLFLGNKALAAGAFLLQTYAISLGSVSVVNALQGVQFAFVFVMAIVFSYFFPKAFTEEVGRGVLLQKFAGIVLISVGVALLV